jgi:hypothetical protein
MLQIRNLLSIFRNHVDGSWGQKSGIWNATWPTCWSSCSLSSFDGILDVHKGSFTKECGLAVDCSRVQERACAKAVSTLCRSTCLVFNSKTCTWVLITCCEAVATCKVECGVTRCGEM